MFDEVIGYFGKDIVLARMFGVSRAGVSQWRKAGYFPAVRALQIEFMTAGRFKAIDLVDPKELKI